MTPRRRSPLPPPSEASFLAQVVRLAKLYGWMCYHTHDSRRSAEGFPDLVLMRPPKVRHCLLRIRPGMVIFAELKTEHGKTTPEQDTWLETIAACGLIAKVWRPSQMQEIMHVLSH